MKRALTVLVSLSLALGLGTYAFSAGRGSPDVWSQTPSANQVSAARSILQACIVDGEVDGSCTDRAIPASMVTAGPVSTNLAYDQLRKEFPLYASHCHNEFHVAGAEAMKSSGALERALVYRGPACQGAYLHGVFDVWGSNERTENDFKIASKLCDFAEGKTARYFCFEGLGHAAWNVTHDVEKSVALCRFSNWRDAREGCLEGIVMQRWAPIVGESGVPATPITEIVKVCNSLADWSTPSVVSPQTVQGSGSAASACRRAAAFPFGLPLNQAQGSEEKYRATLATYKGLCESMRTPGDQSSNDDADWCLVESGEHSLYFSEMDTTKAELWCNELDQRLLKRCVQRIRESSRDNGVGA